MKTHTMTTVSIVFNENNSPKRK